MNIPRIPNVLRNHAYPILKGVAEFYRNFPNVRKESDGLYHIYHVNDNESVWGGHNTIEEISAMMGLFPVAIKASELLGVDAPLRASWKEFVEHLAPLPVTAEGTKTTWKRSLPPMVQGDGDRLPDPNTLPVWFFDLCNLEADPRMQAIANSTFDSYFKEGIVKEQSVQVLSKLPVAGSLLGRKESTRYLIPGQLQTNESIVMPNRMDLREGEQATSIQRLGRAAEAIHFSLCQSIPSAPGKEPVIRIFPAWPEDWDAQFSLLCRNGFLVSSAFRDGAVNFVSIRSQHGKECRLRNPWSGKEVAVYLNGKRWKKLTADLFVFQTRPAETYILVPEGATLNQVMRLSVN